MRAVQTATLPGIAAVVLADSDRAPRVNAGGYSTQDILHWLTGDGDGPRTLVSWGLTPLANAWLSDLDSEQRLRVMTSQPTHWGGWRLLYVPGKFLEIGRWERRWTVYDLSGMWPGGTQLADMAKRWGVADVQLPLVNQGDQLVTREWDGARVDDALMWAVERAGLLAQLARRVVSRMELHGLKPSRLHGVGAIGSRLLREGDAGSWVARYRPDRQPICDGQEMLPLFLSAYYGGRQETTAAGSWEAPTYRYDMRSAYPWALSWVGPVGYVWEAADSFRDDYEWRMSLWHVVWKLPLGQLGPLPWRHPNGAIAYPREGQGWYWWPEVRAALRAYPEYVTVTRGYVSPRSRRRPLLGVIAERYEQRKRLEANDDPTADILKGALASMYGRLAQRLGAEGQPGRWYNPALAGWVCSAVRARLIDAWRGYEGMVASVSTDGFLSSMPIPHLETNGSLGGWKCDQYDSATLVLPGLYELRSDIGNGVREIARGTTGVRGMDFDRLIDQLAGAGRAQFRVRQFVPHILSDLFPDAWGDRRCRWTEQTVTIDPMNAVRKRDGADALYRVDWRNSVVGFGPYTRVGNGDSHPHAGPPAWQPGGTDVLREALVAAMKGR